jgi:hypothetical protein
VALPGLSMEQGRNRPSSGATAWGLPVGTPVVAGASDRMLADLRAGAVAPGVAACWIGTSEAIQGVVPEPRVDGQGRVFCCVLVPGRWVVGGATDNGGNVLRWLGRVVGADLADPDTEPTRLATTVPPGAEGLLMLPNLAGERAQRWSGDPRGPSIDGVAALVQASEVVHPDPHTADLHRELLPPFAATAEVVVTLPARWQDPVPPGPRQDGPRREEAVTS